jgi:catechol 2,3-dioxygenase-like lactoylglutathione lyase family enzyme
VSASLDCVTLVAHDFARSLAFYDAAFAPLGLARTAEFGDEEEETADVEAAGWSDAAGAPCVWLVAGEESTRGAHVRLHAESRADVEAFFAAATTAGGVARRQPRRWAIYRRGDFGAAVADPEGNVLEAVAAE